MLNEEKTKSILMPSQDITLLLHPMISSDGNPVFALLKHVYIIKLNDITI